MQTQAQSIERRWQRFVHNSRIKVKSLYLPLVIAAMSSWNGRRLYLALDTTVLWNRSCMIPLSVICGGRAGYLKIGLRWLKGILYKSRDLFEPNPLLSQDFLPCFASFKAKREYYNAIWFNRISELKCRQI
ncbi:unknown protein [Stanieria sp. NIES-3757]|nr:unknown protein [Stanieria sp. NIES-3757]